VYLDFDGVMAFPKIYVNGSLAGQWDYGYNSFRVDATNLARFDQANVLAVYVDTRDHVSRWYPGAGIYRKVRLTLTSQVQVAHWGTYVTTPSVNTTSAEVMVRTQIENHVSTDRKVTLTTYLFAPDNDDVPISSKQVTFAVKSRSTKPIEQKFTVSNPQLWD